MMARVYRMMHAPIIRVLYRCLFLFPVPVHNNNNYNNNRTTFSVDPDTHIDSIEQAEEMTIEGTSKWSCKIQITGIDAAFYEEQHADLHAELYLLLQLSAYLFLSLNVSSVCLYLCNCHFLHRHNTLLNSLLGMRCRFFKTTLWRNLHWFLTGI